MSTVINRQITKSTAQVPKIAVVTLLGIMAFELFIV